MFQTFVLELIAVASLPAHVAVATVVTYVTIGILFGIVPGVIYVVYINWKDWNCEMTSNCEKFGNTTVKPVLCAVCGPFCYYYGDNVAKLVGLIGDTSGNCSDECQSAWRVSGVAALFFFILINKIRWKSDTPKHWWEPATDMIVNLVTFDAFYTAFIKAAQSNMICTSDMFCRGVDKGFAGAAYVFTIIYASVSIFYSCNKAIKFDAKGTKKVIISSGVMIWIAFAAYLFADNVLPLDFRFCYVPENDEAKAKATKHLHIGRAIASIFSAIIIIVFAIIFAISAYKDLKQKRECTDTNPSTNNPSTTET